MRRTLKVKEAAHCRRDISKRRQVDVLTAQGRPVAEVVRAIGVTEAKHYRWRSEYGDLKGDQVKRPKELGTETTGSGGRHRT